MMRAVEGVDVKRIKPDFQKDFERMLRRQANEHDRNDDIAVHKQKNLAGMPVQPALSTYQRHEIPILERRWNDVMNVRHVLQKTGCDLMHPMIPSTHMPLGCSVVRFRQMRTAVWGTEPVVIDRRLRLNAKGSLRLEIDFCPRYFLAVDPLTKHRSGEEQFEPRTPRAEDLEETAETAVLSLQEVPDGPMNDVVLTGAGGDSILQGRQAMQQNPVELYRRYQ